MCFGTGGGGTLSPQSCRTYKKNNLHTTAGAEQDQRASPSRPIPRVAAGIGRHEEAGSDGTGWRDVKTCGALREMCAMGKILESVCVSVCVCGGVCTCTYGTVHVS